MKTLILFALMAFAVAADDHYVLDKVDIASNIKEFMKFNDCFMSKGPCSELYQSYKVLLPESVKQGCKKCTPEQKQLAYFYLGTLRTTFPEDYVLFRQMYDPENKYFDALENEVYKYKDVKY